MGTTWSIWVLSDKDIHFVSIASPSQELVTNYRHLVSQFLPMGTSNFFELQGLQTNANLVALKVDTL